MISYAVEVSRNGIEWTPDAVFTGKLPLTRAEAYIDETVAAHLYARVVRAETGEVRVTAYPASFTPSDIVRDVLS